MSERVAKLLHIHVYVREREGTEKKREHCRLRWGRRAGTLGGGKRPKPLAKESEVLSILLIKPLSSFYLVVSSPTPVCWLGQARYQLGRMREASGFARSQPRFRGRAPGSAYAYFFIGPPPRPSPPRFHLPSEEVMRGGSGDSEAQKLLTHIYVYMLCNSYKIYEMSERGNFVREGPVKDFTSWGGFLRQP